MDNKLEQQLIRANLDTDNLEDIQYGILGHILTHRNSVGPAMARLSSELFDRIPRDLFEAVNRLFLSGRPVDPVTVRKDLGAEYEAAIGKALALAPSDVDYYIDMLIEYDRLWRVQLEAREILAAGNMAEAGRHIEALNMLLCSQQNVDTVTDLELVARYLTRKASKAPPPEYIRFGMKPLDETLFVRPGDLVVLGGYSSAGKTLISLQFAMEMRKKYRVGYFSLETDNEKMGERMISHYAKVGFRDIKTGTESEEDLANVRRMGVELGDLKGSLTFHRVSGLSLRDIQAITLSRRHQIIFVDYLQIVEAPGRDTRERVSNISMGLHTLAQAHGVTVIALAQLSRPERTKKGTPPPNMWSFKESGQIENDADVAMLLYPSDMNDNKSARVMKVSKNKDGSKVQFLLDFDGAHQTLTPAPPSKAETHKAIMEAANSARRSRAAQGDGQVKFEDLEGKDPDVPF